MSVGAPSSDDRDRRRREQAHGGGEADLGADTPGDRSDTDTPGAESDTDTPGAESDADTPGAESDADTPDAKSDADTPGAESDAVSYEAARDGLAEIVRALETGGLPLEESLRLWERGERLAGECERWLAGARERLDRVVDPTRPPRPGTH